MAIILNRPVQRISELVLGKLGLSPELAVELAAALGGTAEEWLLRDVTHRLSEQRSDIADVRRRAKLYELAPIKELKKRGWIGPVDDIDAIERDLLRLFEVSSIDQEPAVLGAMRKSAPNVALTPAQKAWAFRVRQVAAMIPPSAVSPYQESRIADCMRDIRKLAAYSAEVRKAPALLAAYGIRLVVIEGLPGAKVDGYATWLDPDSPVIGMSLKHDRLDNFWFTLGHELMHIRHRDVAPVDGDVGGPDDGSSGAKSPIERRADDESAALFVPPDELASFIRRVGPLYSTEKINQFANRIKMHPNVIIGQLKHRKEIGPAAHNKNVPKVREAVVKAAVTDGWGKTIHLEASR